MYLDQIKTKYEPLVLQYIPPQMVKPCTKEEIQQLERVLGLRLPLAYQEFLLWMGHGAGGFLAGSDWIFEDLFDLKEAARELLEENRSTEVLPEDTFVFFMHQGYRFLYLRPSEGENPPVYEYSEAMKPPVFRQTFRQFSEFVADELEATQRYIESVKVDIEKFRKSRPQFVQGIVERARASGYRL